MARAEAIRLTTDAFICPKDAIAGAADFPPGQSKLTRSNFAGRRQLSYSFANPYPSAEARDAGWEWSTRLPASFAIAADLNPGVPELLTLTPNDTNKALRAGNSLNHDLEGQNVLYADGSVRYTANQFAGWPGQPPQTATAPIAPVPQDNIYTAGGAETLSADPPVGGVAIFSPPLTRFDSVLLPTADAPLGPAAPGPPIASGSRFWLWIAIPGVLLGGALIVIVAVLSARARRGKLQRGELPEMPVD